MRSDKDPSSSAAASVGVTQNTPSVPRAGPTTFVRVDAGMVTRPVTIACGDVRSVDAFAGGVDGAG
ncbi:hypothetical protein [Labilithrix luteola]|uniref:hypothetical protein n=1 Tax=Labilithrix luteola TaxID=1391654 RepID=UPI001969C0AE|nr:hypothetical protein [Labilithrix luteola]